MCNIMVRLRPTKANEGGTKGGGVGEPVAIATVDLW